MRRAAALIAALLLALGAAPAAAAEGCTWQDEPGEPAFHTPSLTVYRRAFVCPGEAQGTYRLRFEAVAGGRRNEIDTKKGEVKAFGRWPRTTSLHAPLSPDRICHDARAAGLKPVLAPSPDFPGRAPMLEVTVEAIFEGQGALAGLNRTERTTARCRACETSSTGAGLGLYDGRAMSRELRPGTRLRARAAADWYECARAGGTLEVRWFAEDDDAALGRALRPVYVQGGLEKQLRREGDEVRFDLPAPVAEVCRKRPKARRVAWEVAGAGLLGRIGGGGRSYHDLKCP